MGRGSLGGDTGGVIHTSEILGHRAGSELAFGDFAASSAPVK
jgi:hypothetical protein